MIGSPTAYDGILEQLYEHRSVDRNTFTVEQDIHV